MESFPPEQWLGRCIKRITRGAVDCLDEEEVRFYHEMQSLFKLFLPFLAFFYTLVCCSCLPKLGLNWVVPLVF